MRALGNTSREAWPLLDSAPTVAATLPGFEVLFWVGLAAPARTPPAIIERLNAELHRILATPEMQERLARLGTVARSSSGAEMRAMVAGQVTQWQRVVEAAGIKRQ